MIVFVVSKSILIMFCVLVLDGSVFFGWGFASNFPQLMVSMLCMQSGNDFSWFS